MRTTLHAGWMTIKSPPRPSESRSPGRLNRGRRESRHDDPSHLAEAECENQGWELPARSLDENPLADWSSHLFLADRTQYILVSNTKSLYSSVMYGKGITDDGRFIQRALSNLREFMEEDGLEFVYRRIIAPASGTVRFARALDRVVTGSMNELIKYATILLVGGELSPFDVGFRLNDSLLSASAASGAEEYGTPREAFKRLSEFDSSAPGG